MPHILDLADELLSEILAFLLRDGRTPLNGSCRNEDNSIDMRHHGPADDSDLDIWRLVCKRFMRIGTPRRFERFALRCSQEGFCRLNDLLEMQLACYVKSFTYLVRPHYHGSGWDSVLKTLSAQNASLSSLHTQRLREQNAMLETNHDLHQLHRAVNSFTSLQEIKLLRLQDDADEQLISFVGHRALQNARHLSLSWKAACTRAVTNLSTALLNSQHKYIRFAAPQLSPKASLQLLQTPTETISAIASRLTSLNITFTSDRDITIMMASLSDTFNHFFNSATNLSSIHLGFPSLLPLDLDLDAIFHGTTLKNLHTLSLQSWRLASHEITTLTRRHRHTLCELRLCAVYLRPGGRWWDILSTLREELGSLERLHLRDIDYEGHFEATAIVAGVEVMDIQFAETDPPLQMNTPPSQVQDSGFSSGVVGSGLRCRDARRETLTKVAGFTVDDLGDDGIQVRPEQIPLWESWVLAGRKGRSNGHLC